MKKRGRERTDLKRDLKKNKERKKKKGKIDKYLLVQLQERSRWSVIVQLASLDSGIREPTLVLWTQVFGNLL